MHAMQSSSKLQHVQYQTHLLSSTAPAPHVQLSTSTDHDHPVVVAALSCLCIGLHLDVVNVLVAVRLLPQLLDDLVDV